MWVWFSCVLQGFQERWQSKSVGVLEDVRKKGFLKHKNPLVSQELDQSEFIFVLASRNCGITLFRCSSSSSDGGGGTRKTVRKKNIEMCEMP